MMFSSAFANYYYNPVFAFISVAGAAGNGASLIHLSLAKHSNPLSLFFLSLKLGQSYQATTPLGHREQKQ